MKRGEDVSGNVLIYCLFQLTNICLAVLGCFTVGISVYLAVLSKSLNFVNLIFFFFGVVLAVLAYFGCKMRNNVVGNFLYSVVLSAIFFLDTIATVMMLTDATYAASLMTAYDISGDTKADIQKFLAKNIRIVNDLLLIILLILFCVVVFSWWYRKSLIHNQAEWNRSLIDDNIRDEIFVKKKASKEMRNL